MGATVCIAKRTLYVDHLGRGVVCSRKSHGCFAYDDDTMSWAATELRDVDHSAWSVDDDGSIHYKFPGFNNAGGPVENDRLIGTMGQERGCEATCKAENNCHIFTHLFVSPWLRALACSKHHGCYSYDVVPELGLGSWVKRDANHLEGSLPLGQGWETMNGNHVYLHNEKVAMWSDCSKCDEYGYDMHDGMSGMPAEPNVPDTTV